MGKKSKQGFLKEPQTNSLTQEESKADQGQSRLTTPINGQTYQKNKKSIRIDDIDKEDDNNLADEPNLDNGDQEVDDQINFGASNIDESFADSANTPPIQNQSILNPKPSIFLFLEILQTSFPA